MPLSFVAMPRGAFTSFQMIFFLAVHLCRKRKGCPFHASGDVFFFQSVLLFYGFSLKFLYSNLPLFSFTSILRLSVESHQAVIFVLGAKVIPGLDGKARSGLLFSAKISSPSGSILAEKPCIP